MAFELLAIALNAFWCVGKVLRPVTLFDGIASAAPSGLAIAPLAPAPVTLQVTQAEVDTASDASVCLLLLLLNSAPSDDAALVLVRKRPAGSACPSTRRCGGSGGGGGGGFPMCMLGYGTTPAAGESSGVLTEPARG